ncbi:hypothetical protein FHS26_003068 [Rhizobium pisi]|uniref:Uncharacterized protein n=1 Tax=Rhizobium pisi TaxID=574561 RepID=A0A7W5BMI3_9HYPH|nr:hypothetical protein [Rhizobium pisi]
MIHSSSLILNTLSPSGLFPSSTHIYVSVLQKDGGPSYYPVKETIDEVVKLLTA